LVPALNGPVYEGIFTNICSLFPSPDFFIVITPTQVSPVALQARPLVCALERVHVWAINLHCAKVSQPDSFILFANLAALFCADLKART
jgi:hypothetical protein